jgi:hypothetical protein
MVRGIEDDVDARSRGIGCRGVDNCPAGNQPALYSLAYRSIACSDAAEVVAIEQIGHTILSQGDNGVISDCDGTRFALAEDERTAGEREH